jgi:hypothetical protein
MCDPKLQSTPDKRSGERAVLTYRRSQAQNLRCASLGIETLIFIVAVVVMVALAVWISLQLLISSKERKPVVLYHPSIRSPQTSQSVSSEPKGVVVKVFL